MQPALFLTECGEKNDNMMLISEDLVVPKLNQGKGENHVVSNLWYLENGASNHMTGHRSKFDELDKSVTGQVKFRDGPVVHIKEK